MDITEQLTHESRIALAAAAEITRLRAEVEALRADAERYRFMLIDIDTTESIDKKTGRGDGYYWHNQRGYFDYEIAPGKERPTFESLIDAARAAQGERG